MDQRCIRLQSYIGISDCREIFICNVYQAGTFQSFLLGFSDDQSHLVTCKTDHVLTQNGLVSVNETKGVERDICGGQDSHNTGML